MQTHTAADVYMDFQGLAGLKARARQDGEASLKEVSQQFESLLMHMMLKSMRQANLGEGLMDNDQSMFYRDMFDQQLALHLSSGGGLGLAEVIERQLGGARGGGDRPDKELQDYREQVREIAARRASPARTMPKSLEGAAAVVNEKFPELDPAGWSPDDFVKELWPAAKEAADALGLAPQALLAQAALETGWGQHMIRFADGKPSYNLFGIKASRGWEGETVAVDTLEYEQGVVKRETAAFRAYDSFRDSFQDYVDFLKSNPRYREALASTGNERDFFSALQRAGYATDPHYADKISGVLARLKVQKNQPL